MLENMFIGKPPGNYDRLLDFSRAVTGSLFFVPSATFLEDVTADESRRRGGSRVVRCRAASLQPAGAGWFAPHRLTQRKPRA